MTTTLDDTAPRAWIGRLACYNAGRLVADCYAATDADDMGVDALHADAGTSARASCEELWAMDDDGLPIRGERSPMEAAAWGRLLSGIDEPDWGAFCAWVRSTGYALSEDLPDVSEFEDAYAGEWGDFRTYAENLADDICLPDGVPEPLARYFDWDAWTRDLSFDFNVEPAPQGGVYIFRSL